MGKQEIISLVLQLKAADRYEIVEQIMQSLDKSDTEIDRVWAEESVRRVKACTEGRMALIPFDEIFGSENK
jgi:putative addiction module component (TIGR02574 family)